MTKCVMGFYLLPSMKRNNKNEKKMTVGSASVFVMLLIALLPHYYNRKYLLSPVNCSWILV